MLELLLIGFWLLIILNHIINICYLHENNRKSLQPKQNQSISIIIPCRNEELNIADCLTSCIQNIADIGEIIVVDDNSTDNTVDIVRTLARQYGIIRLIELSEKPEGWIGKSYACYQGAQQAQSERLLFLDADVRLKLNAINFLMTVSADLVFIFPQHIVRTIGERLLIPFRLNFLGIFVLPLYAMNLTIFKKALWANAFGCVLLVKKDAYFKTGGHETIKQSLVDDIALAKQFVSHGFKIQAILGQNIASIRMYSSFKSAWEGFVKNYYENFGKSLFNFFCLWFVVFNFFILPFMFIFIHLPLSIGMISVLVLVIMYVLYFSYSKITVLDFLLFPVGVVINMYCCVESFRHGILKLGYNWKSRVINNG